MSIKLQFAIRNILGTGKIQIRRQYSRDIDYVAPFGYQFKCANTPQITSGTYYLQGSATSTDSKWLEFGNTITNILKIMVEYTNFNHWGIMVDNVGDEILITIHNEDNEINMSLLGVLADIKALPVTDDPNKTVKIAICSKCNIENNIQRVRVDDSVSYLCKACIKVYTKCESCNILSENLLNFTNSLGDVKKLCKNCRSTVTCKKCGFNESHKDIRGVVFLTEEGKTATSKYCLSCSKDYSMCHGCEYNYDVKEYPSFCPCSAPKDFKSYIHRFDEDVMNHLPPDSDCIMGIEIEAGVLYKNRVKFPEIYEHTKEILGKNAIMVYDSSIDYLDRQAGIMNNYRGFEIVSRAMNLKNMLKFINDFTKNKHPSLVSWDVGTTGIHIHISKRILSRIEIGKLLLFINNPKNRRLIKHVARRYCSKFARLTNKKLTDYKDNRPECHYEALNTNKKHTIEFRIFRGSLKRETLLSYIQFVISAIEFVKCTPVRELTTNFYLKWLKSTDKSSYRDLKAYIMCVEKRGTLKVTGGDN